VRSEGLGPPTTRLRKPALYPLSYERMVGVDGLEPPCGIPDLQSGAVAAVPHAHGGEIRELNPPCGVHGPAPSLDGKSHHVHCVVGEGFEPPTARHVEAALYH
jgi:hypothetical protein